MPFGDLLASEWARNLTVVLGWAACIGVLLVGLAAWRWARGQGRDVESELAARSRALLAELPVADVMLVDLSADAADVQARVREAADRHLDVLYRYFAVCDEQVALRADGEIRASTWSAWRAEIVRILERPVFGVAWRTVQAGDPGAFPALARLLAGSYPHDEPHVPAQRAAGARRGA